eukprot:Selendium_serpulae@DN6245_c0_g2_i1.p2
MTGERLWLREAESWRDEQGSVSLEQWPSEDRAITIAKRFLSDSTFRIDMLKSVMSSSFFTAAFLSQIGLMIDIRSNFDWLSALAGAISAAPDPIDDLWKCTSVMGAATWLKSFAPMPERLRFVAVADVWQKRCRICMERLEPEWCAGLGEWVYADCILVRRRRPKALSLAEIGQQHKLEVGHEKYDAVSIAADFDANAHAPKASDSGGVDRVPDIPVETFCSGFSNADEVPFVERIRQFAMINLSSDPNTAEDPIARTAMAGLPSATPTTAAFHKALATACRVSKDVSKAVSCADVSSQSLLQLESNCCPSNVLPEDVDPVHISCWVLDRLLPDSSRDPSTRLVDCGGPRSTGIPTSNKVLTNAPTSSTAVPSRRPPRKRFSNNRSADESTGWLL